MNTTQSKSARQRQLPAVSGSAKVLQPIGSVGPASNNTGEISINGKAYFCRCLERCYQLFSFDARKKTTTSYDLPADLSSCECLDFLNRSDCREDGRCKHQKAIAALIAAGRLPVCRRPACVCTVCHVNSVDAEGGFDVCYDCENAA